jgi:hypothetical protein
VTLFSNIQKAISELGDSSIIIIFYLFGLDLFSYVDIYIYLYSKQIKTSNPTLKICKKKMRPSFKFSLTEIEFETHV